MSRSSWTIADRTWARAKERNDCGRVCIWRPVEWEIRAIQTSGWKRKRQLMSIGQSNTRRNRTRSSANLANYAHWRWKWMLSNTRMATPPCTLVKSRSLALFFPRVWHEAFSVKARTVTKCCQSKRKYTVGIMSTRQMYRENRSSWPILWTS